MNLAPFAVHGHWCITHMAIQPFVQENCCFSTILTFCNVWFVPSLHDCKNAVVITCYFCLLNFILQLWVCDFVFGRNALVRETCKSNGQK